MSGSDKRTSLLKVGNDYGQKSFFVDHFPQPQKPANVIFGRRAWRLLVKQHFPDWHFVNINHIEGTVDWSIADYKGHNLVA